MKAFHIVLFIFIFHSSIGQEKSAPTFVNEVSVSSNFTNVSDYNTSNNVGFGIGIYHYLRKGQKLSWNFGLEYNRTTQDKDITYEGQYAYSKDLNYYISTITFPLNIRYTFGSKNCLYFEAGGYSDFISFAKSKGTRRRYSPDNSIWEEKVDSKYVKIYSFNYGLQCGVGYYFSIRKYRFVVKPSYRYGIKNIGVEEDIFNRYFMLSFGLAW